MTTYSTYSVVGPWSGLSHVEIPAGSLKLDADMGPVVAVLERIETAVKEPAPAPRFHVPVPLVTVEAAGPPTVHVEAPTVNVTVPEIRPLVTINTPEPIINITVPEAVPPKIEVIVTLPSLRPLIVANIVAMSGLALLAAAAIYEYIRWL